VKEHFDLRVCTKQARFTSSLPSVYIHRSHERKESAARQESRGQRVSFHTFLCFVNFDSSTLHSLSFLRFSFLAFLLSLSSPSSAFRFFLSPFFLSLLASSSSSSCVAAVVVVLLLPSPDSAAQGEAPAASVAVVVVLMVVVVISVRWIPRMARMSCAE
jgi:hypothetical protein